MNKREKKVLEAALAWVDRISDRSNVNMWADPEDFALIKAVDKYKESQEAS